MSEIVNRARALRPVIEQLAEDYLDDTQALENTELFPLWKADTWYDQGKRLRHEGDDRLYRVRQGHTSSALYPPGSVGSEALYEEVAEEGQGTKGNPIPYNNNMELEEGKYYIQFEVEYYCFRSTGTAVYNNLADLVNIYVNVVEDEVTE